MEDRALLREIETIELKQRLQTQREEFDRQVNLLKQESKALQQHSAFVEALLKKRDLKIEQLINDRKTASI